MLWEKIWRVLVKSPFSSYRDSEKVCLCSSWPVVSVTIANIRPPASVPIATASWVTSGRSSVAPAWASHVPETVWPPGGDWLSSLILLQYKKEAPCSGPAWDAANPSAQSCCQVWGRPVAPSTLQKTICQSFPVLASRSCPSSKLGPDPGSQRDSSSLQSWAGPGSSKPDSQALVEAK